MTQWGPYGRTSIASSRSALRRDGNIGDRAPVTRSEPTPPKIAAYGVRRHDLYQGLADIDRDDIRNRQGDHRDDQGLGDGENQRRYAESRHARDSVEHRRAGVGNRGRHSEQDSADPGADHRARLVAQ